MGHLSISLLQKHTQTPSGVAGLFALPFLFFVSFVSVSLCNRHNFFLAKSLQGGIDGCQEVDQLLIQNQSSIRMIHSSNLKTDDLTIWFSMYILFSLNIFGVVFNEEPVENSSDQYGKCHC